MYISSDTNIWLDLLCMGNLNYPFLLNNKYYLSDITFHDEIDYNINFVGSTDYNYEELRKCVNEKKILIIEVSINEIKLAMEYSSKYIPPKIRKPISLQDSIALAIAKQRNWCLLTGDSSLRQVAEIEGVVCHGTIWIYDELFNNKIISKREYITIMKKLLVVIDSGKRFLPKNEIIKRIEKNHL